MTVYLFMELRDGNIFIREGNFGVSVDEWVEWIEDRFIKTNTRMVWSNPNEIIYPKDVVSIWAEEL
jgi:hypothetical protein